jgi:hypothetical protein
MGIAREDKMQILARIRGTWVETETWGRTKRSHRRREKEEIEQLHNTAELSWEHARTLHISY